MTYLLHGKDDYRIRARLREIRAELESAGEPLEANATTLDGRTITPGELLAHVSAAPFLASHRLVVVEGLLHALGETKGGRRKKTGGDDDPLEPWRKLAKTLGDSEKIPETTVLVLIEGELTPKNPAFTIFAPVSRTVDHPPLDQGALGDWITETVRKKGANIAPRAIASLAQLIGPDLWTLDTEIDKLAAYAGKGEIDPEMVSELVSAARETKIWALADALVAGNEPAALRSMRWLIAEGQPAPVLAFMVVRQYRQIAIVKDMRERGARQDEVARAAGLPGFRLSAVGALASRYSWDALRAIYARLLEADLSVKRGLQDDESSLQLLIHDLCALAPKSGGRPAIAPRR